MTPSGTGSGSQRHDLAVVGGGPAGAALAARVARRGRSVVLLEASPAWHWRACGVFTSPAAVAELRDLGVAADLLGRVARPVPRMRVESPRGTNVDLTYGAVGSSDPTAVGFDRSVLDPAMLRFAAEAGADVRLGSVVEALVPATGGIRLVVRSTAGGEAVTVSARLVAGADGIRSTVARALGVTRRPRLAERIGLTCHLDGGGEGPAPGRMVVVDAGYVGIAPVPGGRVNVGIVLDRRRWGARLAAEGAASVVDAIVADLPPDPGGRAEPWRAGSRLDRVEGAVPVGHRVSRAADRDWLLVGDAAGFLDPFTGEGLHRALVSARLAATAVDRRLDGIENALPAYAADLRRRFRAKDVVSELVQRFLERPALFDYALRRLAGRAGLHRTFELVMGDLAPASRALDPRFLAALLAP